MAEETDFEEAAFEMGEDFAEPVGMEILWEATTPKYGGSL
jgi:hypothetical protein